MAQTVKFTALDGQGGTMIITANASNIMKVEPTSDSRFVQVLVRGMKHNLKWYLSAEPQEEIENRIRKALRFQ